jgi:hypothetical protein
VHGGAERVVRNIGVACAVIAAAACSLTLGGCAAPATPVSAADRPASTSRTDDAVSTPTAAPDRAGSDSKAAAGQQSAQDPERIETQSASEPGAGAHAADPTIPPALVPAARCVDEQLALAYVPRPQDSGAGSFIADLVFTNTSASECSFAGWPGLIAEDAAGAQLGGPALAEGSEWPTVVLAAHGGTAVATLRGGNPGAWGCPTATSATLRAFISSDGAGPGVAVAQQIPVCADRTSTLGLGSLRAN